MSYTWATRILYEPPACSDCGQPEVVDWRDISGPREPDACIPGLSRCRTDGCMRNPKTADEERGQMILPNVPPPPPVSSPPPPPPAPSGAGGRNREGESLLTDDEHRALKVTGELWKLITEIVGDGQSRTSDLHELCLNVHAIQNQIMAQAAARAYPDRYRLLGSELVDRPHATWQEANA